MAVGQDERDYRHVLTSPCKIFSMEKIVEENDRVVHLHRKPTDAFYVSVCGMADKSSYVTLNRMLVTCGACIAEER